MRFEANGGAEPSLPELEDFTVETLTQKPVRLAFVASCDHTVVFKCALSQIHECQALVAALWNPYSGTPATNRFLRVVL